MDGQGWSGLRDAEVNVSAMTIEPLKQHVPGSLIHLWNGLQGRVWQQCTPDLSLDITVEEPVTQPPKKRRRTLAPN